MRQAIVREFIELAGAGDVARMKEMLDPDVVWFGTRGGLDEDQVLRGPQAVIEYVHEIREAWQRFDSEVEQVAEAGDAIVVFIRETGQSRQGGPEMERETAVIFRFRDGRIAEMTGYLDRDEALRAAGLTT